MCEMSAFKLLTVASLQSTQSITLFCHVTNLTHSTGIISLYYHMTTLSLPPLFFQLACHRARQFFFPDPASTIMYGCVQGFFI